MSQWLEAITAVRRARAEKPPKDFLTAAQIAEREKLSHRTCRAMLRELQLAGRIDIRIFKVPRGDGRLMAAPHYRLK